MVPKVLTKKLILVDLVNTLHKIETKSMIIIYNLNNKRYLVISSTIVASSALYNAWAHVSNTLDIQKSEYNIAYVRHKYVYKLCNITFHGVLDLSMSSYRRCRWTRNINNLCFSGWQACLSTKTLQLKLW